MFRNIIFATLALIGLAACATDTAPAPVLSFAQQVQAFDADASTKLAAYASGALTDTKTVGQSLCGYASMANGLFKLAVPVMALAGVDPAVGGTEAAVMGGVQLACAAIDNATPDAPGLAGSVIAVASAVARIKANLQAVAPAAAAAATAPVPTPPVAVAPAA
jgi:hypothetical protein